MTAPQIRVARNARRRSRTHLLVLTVCDVLWLALGVTGVLLLL